ncbi:hypothetical protein L208DRAFT_1412678 [Tricholoma matsutake]|nr:hypothetical protein L208DRAFT_1412678 [Tricholoma matsutake 945]
MPPPNPTAPHQNDNGTTGRQGRGNGTKKAHGMLSMSLGPVAACSQGGLRGQRNNREEKNKEIKRRKTKQRGKENEAMGKGHETMGRETK